MIRSAWGLLLVVALAASLWLVLEADDPEEHHHDEAAISFLLPLPLSDVTALELLKAGRLTRYERAEDGVWFLHPDTDLTGSAPHQHNAPTAAGEQIGETLGMFSRARIERSLGPLADRRAAFGLTYPDTVLALYRAGSAGPVLRLEFGDLAPDGLSRYVLLVDQGQMVSIPNFHLTNLLTLLPGQGS